MKRRFYSGVPPVLAFFMRGEPPHKTPPNKKTTRQHRPYELTLLIGTQIGLLYSNPIWVLTFIVFLLYSLPAGRL